MLIANISLAQIPSALTPYGPSIFNINKHAHTHKVGDSLILVPGLGGSLEIASSIPSVSIAGLGTTQLTSSISPNLNVQMNIRPTDNKLLLIPLNFNLGTSKDTVALNSLTLVKVFYPDNSSLGFSAGIQYDILPLFKKNLNYTFSHPHPGKKDNNNLEYFSVIPDLNFAYRKIVINSLNTDSLHLKSQIETFNIYFGIHCIGTFTIGTNTFSLGISPYYKYQNVGSGTDATYQYIFKAKNDGNRLPNTIQDIGIQFDIQISKVQLSFSYDNPLFKKSDVIADPYLKSGVATLRAVIVGDFLGFNF